MNKFESQPPISQMELTKEQAEEFDRILDGLEHEVLEQKGKAVLDVKAKFHTAMSNMWREARIAYKKYLDGLAIASKQEGELAIKVAEMAKGDFEDKIRKLKEEIR